MTFKFQLSLFFHLDYKLRIEALKKKHVVLLVPSHAEYPSRKPPGSDYGFIAGLGYYKFHPELKTWFMARDICEQEGSHLVVLNSQREASELIQLWKKHPHITSCSQNDWAHAGFHDLNTEGEYVTVKGKNLLGKQNTQYYIMFAE